MGGAVAGVREDFGDGLGGGGVGSRARFLCLALLGVPNHNADGVRKAFPVLELTGKEGAPLQPEHPRPAPREPVPKGPAPCPGADDDHVIVLVVRHGVLAIIGG